MSAVPQMNTAPFSAPLPFCPAVFKMEQAVYMPTLTLNGVHPEADFSVGTALTNREAKYYLPI